jgi:hypothetical protein
VTVRALLAASAALALAAPCPAAAADPGAEFDRAKNAFSYGDYTLAARSLHDLLNPRVLLDTTDDIKEALELLGISRYYEDQRPEAREAFVRLLSLDPDHHLDPLLVPPPLVEFFDGIASELRARLDELRKKKEAERLWQEQQQASRVRTVTITRRELELPYVLNFVPFGVPQLVYEESAWGTFFLASQAGAAAASMGGFIAASLAHDDGDQAGIDGGNALALGAGIALSALVAWGIVDGILRWPGEPRVIETRKEEEASRPALPPPKSEGPAATEEK